MPAQRGDVVAVWRIVSLWSMGASSPGELSAQPGTDPRHKPPAPRPRRRAAVCVGGGPYGAGRQGSCHTRGSRMKKAREVSVDKSTEAAWAQFRRLLADRLAKLDIGDV